MAGHNRRRARAVEKSALVRAVIVKASVRPCYDTAIRSWKRAEGPKKERHPARFSIGIMRARARAEEADSPPPGAAWVASPWHSSAGPRDSSGQKWTAAEGRCFLFIGRRDSARLEVPRKRIAASDANRAAGPAPSKQRPTQAGGGWCGGERGVGDGEEKSSGCAGGRGRERSGSWSGWIN